MSQWKSRLLEIQDHTIRVLRTGGPNPPLVLVHGYTDSAACWTYLARALEGEYDAIMPDAYGHGQSARADKLISLHDLADELVAVIDALGVGRVVALGHSMGAATLALAATSYPDRFQAIALEDPPWRAKSLTAEEGQAMGSFWSKWLMDFRQKSTEEALAETEVTYPEWTKVDMEAYVASRQQFDLAIQPRLNWDVIDRWRETVSRIQCPFLLMTADPEQEAIVTAEVAQEAMALNGHGEWVCFPDTGHHIHRQRFDDFLASLRPFLSKHS
jgi:pimeloyl-ACP methyl ester carboxylesterase